MKENPLHRVSCYHHLLELPGHNTIWFPFRFIFGFPFRDVTNNSGKHVAGHSIFNVNCFYYHNIQAEWSEWKKSVSDRFKYNNGVIFLVLNVLWINTTMGSDYYSKAHICYIAMYQLIFRSTRSNLGHSSISLVHVCSTEVFITLSKRPWEEEAVKLDLPTAPSHHLVSASTSSELGDNKQFATKIHRF